MLRESLPQKRTFCMVPVLWSGIAHKASLGKKNQSWNCFQWGLESETGLLGRT
jgi:hypothetical protein